jgi:SAM-dependent methyltransferase
MTEIDLESAEISVAQRAEAARRLADKNWATTVLARWQKELTLTAVRIWMFPLGLLAAEALGRAEEFIPTFDNFLAQFDAQSKPDWHGALTESALSMNIISQSGRIGQPVDSFHDEFKRIVSALGSPDMGTVLDVGCAGGAYATELARLGFTVLGTDHHAGIIERAKENAMKLGVADKTAFIVDEATNSNLPDGVCSRAICISVTVCLPDDKAFESLISHLDRVTRRKTGEPSGRRVILGHNRWRPTRLTALRAILEDAAADRMQAINRLNMLQVSWWMAPHHLEIAKRYFPSVTILGELRERIDGTRVDLLLQ